ncbi:winged helix DNA-binding protein [Novosphingobium sp. JCM 18896]|uniref:winged helix DNA-binding protein n=1 Tax=Novosphingobium sp. JCM 18896 TaxID=2989731 RepID=UPI002222E78B|nr:winged helix DNA-binding protein [Novosphingobium sp. JCM 18896]MCW1429738.1 winged helix DNA-binding protein [Novosphingobium sp. JCM 18896]
MAWVAARQARNRVLDSSLFADPAWDMLLDLYICHAQNRPETISDACVASGVPPTTALRWISILESRNLVERSRDPKDRRRTFLHLTPEGLRKMEDALDAASDSDARLGLGRLRAVR